MRQIPPIPRMSRSRGAVSRAASALMFALAGVAAFVFPEGEAGALSAAGGFAPAQVPTQGVLPEERYYASQLQDRYRNPVLCTDLGGTLQEVGGEWVCQGLDGAGTFCIVGSQDVFPCRGLFRHVIQCNDVYNRSALNPFICDGVCQQSGAAPWEVKARGPNCEFVIPEEEIIAEADRTVDLPNFPAGYTGVLATLQVSLLTFQGTEYESHTLINDRPLGPGVPEANADQLTISAGNVLEIPEYAPLRAGETQRVLVAKNSCPRLPGQGPRPSFRGSADLGCYPVFVNITANFAEVIALTDIRLLSVAANLPAAAVTLKTAVGHSGLGYDIALTNTMDYALVNIAYDTDAHGFDPDNGIILLDTPLQAGAPITAEVEADIECRTIPFCNPARISVTVVFEPVAAPPQPPASLPETDPFFLSVPITLPGGYVHSEAFTQIPGFEDHLVATLEVVGIDGYAGDTADFVANDGGNLSNEDSRALLPAGDYVFTIQMTADDLLGMILFEISLNIYPEGQIPPDKSIPASERKIFQAVAPGHSGSIAFFRSADATIGLSTPGPDPADTPPFSTLPGETDVTIFPPDGIVLYYTPDDTNPLPPGETRVLTLSFRSEKMPGSDAVEEDFMVTVTVSIVAVPPQTPLETDTEEDFMHPLVIPGFDLADGEFLVVGVENADDGQPVFDPFFDVVNGILQRRRTGDVPPPVIPGNYIVTVEVTHPDISGPVTMTISVAVRGVLNPAIHNLSAPADPILVAPGYAGNLRLQPPANISLASTAGADVTVTLPESFPAGVSLELSADSREVTPHLADPLAAEEELIAVLSLTLVRDLYDPLEQLVTVAVSALALPAVASAEVIAFSPQNIFAAGGDIIDLSAADYENGVYDGATFQKSGVLPELNVRVGGTVFAETDLALGEYQITVVALGRPATSGAQFLGEVRITVSVGAVQGAETIAPDDVVPAVAREVSIDAAVGYAGAGYAVSVADDFELTQESWEETAFDYDADGEVILITTAVGGDPVSYTVIAQANCTDASGRLCDETEITIVANFNPVSAPAQAALNANYLDGFAHSLALPAGYENGGGKDVGRTLTVSGVGGWTGDLAALSLAVNGETLEYAPDGVAENALTPGEYTVALEMTQSELLGTVAFEVAANISPRPLVAADYGVSELPLVTIVPGPNGVGLEIASATLTGGAADAVLAIPDPANFPDKLSLALSADERGFTLFVTAAFTSEEVAEIGVPFIVSRPGGNYAPLDAVASVTVRALRQPDLIEQSAAGIPYSQANIANLKTGVFENATRFTRVDAESDAGLQVDETTGIVSTDGDLGVGTYNLVVDAISPDFFGVIRLSFRLVVSDRPILTPAQTIPSGQRSRQIAAAAGYSGSVAFFVASSVGVTLQTPSTAPDGFNLGGADALNAGFVSPEGFTLFLETGQIPNGGDQAAAEFEIAASLGGHEAETITLNITVLAIAADQPVLIAPESAPDYAHDLTPPAGYSFSPAGTLQIVGVHDTVNDSPVDFAALLTLDESNNLQPVDASDSAARLAVGRYLITVEMTHPTNFLGAVNLLITADIQEELLPANVVADRDVSQLVVVGHSGEGYEIPVVTAAYTLANAAYDENEFTLALDYELQILNPMPNSDLAATLAADVLCADQSSRSCAPLRISLTITYAPVSHPMLERTERVTVAGDGDEDPYNDPNIAALNTGNFANATFAKVPPPESSVSLLISEGGTISTDGNLFVGAYTLFADATSPDFLGTARASLGLTVRGMLNPEVSRDHYGLHGPDRDPAIVAPGYTGGLQGRVGAVYLAGAAVSQTDARIVLPSENPAAGVTVRYGAAIGGGTSETTAEPHLTDPLGPGDVLEFVLTLTVERIGELYDKLPQLKTIKVSALAVPETALATVAAEPAVDIFNTGGVVISLDTSAYANEFYSNADFNEHADASNDLNVDPVGVVSAQRDLPLGAYEFTVLAEGFPRKTANFIGIATIVVSVEVERGAETIAPDDVIAAAAREVDIDAAVGYAGDGYTVPVSVGYELTGETYDDATFDYDAANEVIQIRTAIAGDDPVSYTVIAQANCTEASGRLCTPVDITVAATFNPVSAPGQAGVATMYLDPFIALLDLPDGYKSTDANTKFAGVLLSVSGVNGWTGILADLSLQAANGQLGYSPNGVAEDALTAGQYTITVEMTHPDLLGTVAMDVAANITPRALPLADYGFSEAPVVAVAPGASAVGQSIAAFALTGGAADAQVALPDEANFPAKLSLELSADNRGFTVYVSAPFTSGEVAVHNNIPLTVTRPGGNYAPLEVPAALTVGALSQPAPTERSATGVPHNDASIADLKTIGGAVYVNATFEKASGDAELTVNADGVVSTNGDITAAGTYNIAVDATSPDFVGTVRFVLQLILTDRLVLLPANTIPTAQRDQTIPVVAGYAGSVAFFVASSVGVTLQTPAAPSGFNFGANGANANFVSPVGFTLFVDQLDAGQAVAAFQVSAALAEHEGEDITLNITVAAVPAPAQALLRAVHTTSDYEYDLTAPADYPFGGGELRILGARNTVTGESVDDIADRVTLHVGRILNPVDAADENARLNPGHYVITVAFTHPGFLGEMNLPVTADIGERLDPDDVVAAAARNVTQPVAVGHPGVGYEIPVEAGYALENHEFNDLVINLDGDELEVIHPRTAGAPDLVVALTADVTCADANRNCRPLKLTLTVTYTFVSAPAQTAADAQYLVAFDHPLALPSGYETGGANSAGRALNITGVNGLADSSKLSLNIDGDNLKYAPNGVAEDALTVGGYTVTVEMTQTNLLGTVTMEVAANITRAQLDPAEYGIPSPAVDYDNFIPIVAGEGGNDALVAIASLTAGVDATISGFTQRRFPSSLTPDNRGIEIRTRPDANYAAGNGQSAVLTVTISRGNPNYADLVVELTVVVFAFAPPPLLELSAQGSPTYTSDNIANLLTDAFSHNRYNGAILTQVGAADTDLNFASDTGIVSGTNLAAGTHTLTVDATAPFAVNTRPNFVGFSRAELILTVELASPNPDNVVADREVTQPVAVGHSGDPGYVIPVAANYTLANPDYDETQITIANGNEIRLVDPMPNANLVAALTADVQCIDANIGACGPLKMTLTATFTPVSTGTFLNLILPNRTDPFGTHRVPRPAGYPNAAVAITRTSHIGILRHDGTQIETLAPPSYFALNADDDLVQGPAGFPVAGNHGIGFGATDPGYLGTVAVVGVVQSPANALGPDFALAETSAVVTVVPGYSGRAYETTLQTPAAVIGSPYVVSPDSGFLASTLGISGNTALAVDILGADTVTPGAADILATIRATIGNGADPDNYQPVGAQLELRVVALPAAPLLELSAPGTPTYSSNSIADFTTGDYAAYANAAFQKDDSESSAELQLVDGDSGVVSGSNLAAGTYTLAMEATSPDFVGTARLSLRLTVELSSPNPDDVIADREVTQPVAILHSGAPGYVIPVAANYTLANPSYDEAQITLADNHEVRLVNPMPAGFDNVVAALTADVECVDPSVGLCGPLQISVTITFTPVNPGLSFDFLVVNPADTDLTFPVALPSGYARDDAVVNIVSIGFTGILRHDGVQIEEPRNNAFDISGTDIVRHADGFPPDAGTYRINMEVTHSGFLGRLSAVEIGTVNPDALGPQYALAETAATVTVVPGFAGVVYQTTLQTSDGVIGSPYVVPPAASGVLAGLFGDATLGVVIEDIVGPGAADILATIRATIGNAADPDNFRPVGAQLELRIAALPETPATVYTFAEETYNNAALHDFRTVSPFENATFTEVPDDGGSAELNVTPEGVVGTDGQIPSTGTYAITVEATDASAFVGSARLTLTLRLVGTDANALPGELLAAFAPSLNVAQGETGEIHRLEPLNGYTFDYDPQEANPQLVLESGTGAISIPTGETMGTDERRVTIGAEVICPAGGNNPRGLPCLGGQQVEIVVVADGVANPAANFAVFYDQPDFAETIPLPAGYAADALEITLPPQTGLGLTPDGATLTLDETNYPAARVHPVPVEYAHPAPDLSGAGFWGTLTAAINLTVQQANPPTIPASEIGTGSAPGLRSTVFIGPGVSDATLRAWSGTEGGSPGASAEFRGPPLAKTEFFPRYFSELSADRKTFFFSLNPENDTVRNTAANGGQLPFVNRAELTLVGPGDDSANYAEVVQDVYLLLVFRPAPSASPDLQMNAPLAANSQIFNFREDTTGGYNYATHFANATFEKISGSDELTITPQGVVQNPNQIDAGGNYNIVAQATSDDWVGTARVSLALEVLTAQDVLFNGEVLRAPVAGSPQTIVMANITAEALASTDIGGSSQRTKREAALTLRLVDMAYHGVWRGLHWVYGTHYQLLPPQPADAARASETTNNANVLGGEDHWFHFSVCQAGGEGWRLPLLSEMVGGVADGAGAGTETLSLPSGFIGPLHIQGGPAVQQIRVPYPPANATRDTAAGPLPLVPDAYHSKPFFSEDSVQTTSRNRYSIPTGVVRQTGSATGLANPSTTTSGRIVCVLEDGGELAYRQEHNPREWAIALTESNVPATVAMDNIGENSAVAVGATVYLGVFNERGLETPATLTADMRVNNDGKAADLRMARHDVYTDYFRFGLFPVHGGGSALSVWALPNARNLDEDIRDGSVSGFDQSRIRDYESGLVPLVLEIGFAPDGNYFGRDQIPDLPTAGEQQFAILKLTITFTPPPPPPPPPSPIRFNFGGEGVSVVGQVVAVTAFDGSNNKDIVAQMEYAGLRGGLEVMRSTNDSTERDAAFGDRLCTGEGGAEWRNPKITEVAMLVTAPSVTALTADVATGTSGAALAGYADASNDLVLTFPALGPLETAVGDSLLVGLVNDYVDAYRLEVANDGSAMLNLEQGNISQGDAGVMLCVRETDAYDPSQHNHLVGIRIGDETYDEVALLEEVGERTAPQSSTRSAFTITANAWHYADADGNAFLAIPSTVASEPISVRLNDSADSSTYELLATPVNGQPGVLEVVILLNAESTADDDVVLLFETELGDSRLLTVTIPSGSGGTANSAAAVNFTAGSNGALSAASDGSALTSGGNVTVDRIVTFTATPNAGYYVSAWTGDAAGAGCATGISETDSVDCRIRVPSGGLSVGVSFAEVPPLLVYGAAVSHLGGGRIIAAHGGALLASGAQIEDGDEITLTATPSDGFHLLYWEGDGTASCASGSSQTDAVECEVTAGSSGVEVSAFFNDVHESELTALCTEAVTSNTDAARIRTVKGYAEGATPDGTGPDVGAVCIFGDSGSPLSDTRTCFAPGNAYRTSHAILYDSTATAGNRDLSAVTFCANDDF